MTIRGVRRQRERALRIAHLTTVDMSLALLLETELRHQIEAGHEVVGISAPGRYLPRITALGVRHEALPSLTRSWSPARDVRAFVGLVRLLARLDLDVLHTHNPKTGVLGRIAGRLARVPVVVNTCHGLWARPDDPVAKRWFVIGMEALAARFSDFELFQNAEDLATLHWALKPGRARVVGNGVDLTRFVPDPAGRARVREEWGVNDDDLVVGTVGRRVHEKGVVEFTQAASQLSDRAVFVWVGPEDDTNPGLRDGADAPVRFIAERTDMPSVYSAFDVFVLASHREGLSRASMEAAACGRPMVLTDIRGCREIGEDGVHLLLAGPSDAASLALAISRLLDDAELRGRLGMNARRRAQTEFDQRRVAALSLSTYQEALARKG